jgi:hypothetical protein
VKYLGIICLVLVVAFGAMGVGYANYQQDLTVTGRIQTGSWNMANYAVIDVTGAPDCTVESIAERTFTIKYHSKDNNRHEYSGSVICPISNNGTIPFIIDNVQITIFGPDRDPSSTNLQVIPTGALVQDNHIKVDAGSTYPSGLVISGDPYKGDYYVTVTFTTKLFNQ